MHSVRLEPTKSILIGTRTTFKPPGTPDTLFVRIYYVCTAQCERVDSLSRYSSRLFLYLVYLSCLQALKLLLILVVIGFVYYGGP